MVDIDLGKDGKMEPQYPVFILANDDLSINMIMDPKQLSGWYEKIDVEEGLYRGWDVNGYPLRVLWDPAVGTKVEICGDFPQEDKLREAILDFAKIYRSKISFVYSGPEDNIVELFKTVEEHIKPKTLTQKIKYLFHLKY